MNKSRLSPLFAALVITQSHPDIEIKGFQLVESSKNQRSLEIVASKAYEFKDNKTSQLKNINAKIWTEKKEIYIITGDDGEWNSEKKSMVVTNNVTFVTPDSYVFRMNELNYNEKKKLISSDTPLTGKEESKNPKNNLSLSGVGFWIDLREGSYEIKNKVVARQYLSQDQWLYINSSQSKVDPRKNLANFEKNVTLKMQKTVITGDTLSLNYVEKNDQFLLQQFTIKGQDGTFSHKNVKAQLDTLSLQSKGLVIDFDDAGKPLQSHAIGEVEGRHAENLFHADSLVESTVDGKKQIAMEGTVKIKTPDKIASCQNAIYYPDEAKFILQNGAHLETNDQIIEGERIEFSSRSSEVIINKAKGTLNKNDVMSTDKDRPVVTPSETPTGETPTSSTNTLINNEVKDTLSPDTTLEKMENK